MSVKLIFHLAKSAVCFYSNEISVSGTCFEHQYRTHSKGFVKKERQGPTNWLDGKFDGKFKFNKWWSYNCKMEALFKDSNQMDLTTRSILYELPL